MSEHHPDYWRNRPIETPPPWPSGLSLAPLHELIRTWGAIANDIHMDVLRYEESAKALSADVPDEGKQIQRLLEMRNIMMMIARTRRNCADELQRKLREIAC